MRKLIFTSLAIMLYTAGSFAQDVHYPLKSDVKDTSGSGLDGTVVNTVTYETDPIRGEVAVLGANDGYITLPPIFEGYEAEATVAVWFRNDNPAINWAKLFSFGLGQASGDGGHREGFWLTPTSEWGENLKGNFATCLQAGKGWHEDGTMVTPYVAGEWHHYAMTISAAEATVYVDGEVAYTIPLGDDFDLTMVDDTENYIGRGYWHDPAIIGAVSDMQIHYAALTQAEIKTIMGSNLGSEEIAIAKASIKM
ncbi:MAG: LamG domain-containing protein, partial [Chlamydiia bacterium]|nr:LamG domain-containing protein [Chlamydiia bacterium]